jgi:Patatin-like phospholipase
MDRVWGPAAEAERTLETGEPDRVRRILLASSAIPGALPPRGIDSGLYAEGALTGNIPYGGRGAGGEDSAAALRRRLCPGTRCRGRGRPRSAATNRRTSMLGQGGPAS